MRLIDADALIDSLNIRSVTYNCIINKCIDDAPTINAVSVVRCEECEKQSYCNQTVGKTKKHDGFIEYWTEEIEWCSKGVRREGGEA